jgi:hypothetical protein
VLRVAGACIALLLCLCFDAVNAVSVAAQIQPAPLEPAAQDKAGKQLQALRITGQVPLVDGEFDDEIWTMADAIDDFTQEDPDNMQPATPNGRSCGWRMTTVRCMWPCRCSQRM